VSTLAWPVPAQHCKWSSAVLKLSLSHDDMLEDLCLINHSKIDPGPQSGCNFPLFAKTAATYASGSNSSV
jgi:hypothetical protein